MASIANDGSSAEAHAVSQDPVGIGVRITGDAVPEACESEDGWTVCGHESARDTRSWPTTQDDAPVEASKRLSKRPSKGSSSFYAVQGSFYGWPCLG